MIPIGLSEAIEAEAAGVNPAALAAASRDLTERYREMAERTFGGRGAPVPASVAHRAAYAVVRVPATFAAASAALSALRERLPDFAPLSALDLGAGVGAAAWAACEVFPSLCEITLVERDAELIAMGRRFADRAEHPALPSARRLAVDLAALVAADESSRVRGRNRNAARPLSSTADFAMKPRDLVILSYVLGEIPSDARDRAIDAAWEWSQGAVVTVEPGTTAGFARILEARALLVAAGGRIAAPCPHDARCPMEGGPSWCHFSERLARSRRHRIAKEATLGYEDEKYSYVAAVRGEVERSGARVIDEPHVEKGGVALPLCGPDGLGIREIPRRDKTAYKQARKLRWGDWVSDKPPDET